MKKQFFGMTVDDVALKGWAKPENLKKLIEFFDREKLRATFFVVPVDEESGKPFDSLSEQYIPLIRQAHSNGHAFEQHGLKHNRFELGVPPMMILNLPHETENKRYAEEKREEIAAEQTCEKCRQRLRAGRQILENALGFKINGFRAPALQQSSGMFEALAAEGYCFDSSQCMQETGWDYIMDKMNVPRREITRARYEELRKKSAVGILPLTTDYTWYLTLDKYDAAMAMARADFLDCIKAEIPFITVCHVDPVMEGEGIRFLSEFFAWCRQFASEKNIELEFLTLKEIAEKIN